MDDQELMLSVVATSRNDDHGANLRRRMQTFVSAFIAQCQRHAFPAELILVEWNPPADRPRLADALRWPADSSPCQVRIIEVPEALHRRLSHSQALPLFQMIAKNVGIRRARGRFVLATNIDILFNDELMGFFKEGRLEAGKVYRIDRTDVETDVPESASVEEQLAYCRGHHVRLNTAFGTFPLNRDGTLAMSDDDVADPNSGIVLTGDVSAGERDGEGKVFRWAGGDVRLMLTAPADRPRRLLMELSPGPCVRRLPAALEVLRDRKVVARGHVIGRSLVSLALPVLPGESAVLEVRAVEGGHFPPPPPDCRVLDFAVHRLGWSEEGPGQAPASPEDAFRIDAFGASLGGGKAGAAGDVIDTGVDLRLGQGWYPAQGVAGLRCRWADSGAGMTVERGGTGLALRLWVGASRAATLQLRDEAGKDLAEAPLRRGPHAVTLPLPATFAAPGRVFFHVSENGADPAGGQGLRAFRLFSCAWSDAPRSRRVAAGVRSVATGLLLHGRDAARALGRLRRRLARWARGGGWAAPGTKAARLPRLHTNACGDFTLMAREHWHQLRAYPELEMYSLHIDSVLMYAGHVAGLEEVILPDSMRAYHIEHSAGSGWTPEGESRLFARLRGQGIPVLAIGDLYEMAHALAARGDPALFGRDDWGLAGARLPETRPGGAAPAAAA
jgi:hypothetical protein